MKGAAVRAAMKPDEKSTAMSAAMGIAAASAGVRGGADLPPIARPAPIIGAPDPFAGYEKGVLLLA
eukprot:scaffold15366_cov90-Isochrysis_galbana.AAC.1